MLTGSTRMKKSTLLSLAVNEFLSDGTPETQYRTAYLCTTVWDAGKKYNQMETAREIRDIIESLIEPYSTVVMWLYHTHNIIAFDYPAEVRQDYRNRWAHHLIEQFTADGD